MQVLHSWTIKNVRLKAADVTSNFTDPFKGLGVKLMNEQANRSLNQKENNDLWKSNDPFVTIIRYHHGISCRS